MVTSLLSAQAWRAKYLSSQAYQRALASHRTAVVVGATSGIGEACAHRLAEQGFLVVAVGRDRPGRAEAVVAALKQKGNDAEHEFYPCDAFSLRQVYETGQRIQAKHPNVDALVLTQGMATLQGFTPTPEGNDEKMTLHYYSRMAMIQSLLPALRFQNQSDNDMPAVVVSVLSGGVHSPYKHYAQDPSLQTNYSLGNAANAAGYYNDLGLDQCARDSPGIHWVHASPGFVHTNWGTELPPLLRRLVRWMQPLGRPASDCAECLMGATVLAVDAGETLSGNTHQVHIVGSNGETKNLTTEHTDEARNVVWKHTRQVLRNAGIPVELDKPES
jgi:NAD(P)-dependent dehydrogenase (short-subunit alcohol dehydrogenase family)